MSATCASSGLWKTFWDWRVIRDGERSGLMAAEAQGPVGDLTIYMLAMPADANPGGTIFGGQLLCRAEDVIERSKRHCSARRNWQSFDQFFSDRKHDKRWFYD